MIIWPASASIDKRIARWGPLLILILRIPYIFCDVDRYRCCWIARCFRVPTPAIAIDRCLLAAAIVKDALNLLSLPLRALVLPSRWINKVGVDLLELYLLPIALPLLIVLPIIRCWWRFFPIRLHWYIIVPWAILIFLEAIALSVTGIMSHFYVGRMTLLFVVLILIVRCVRIYNCEPTSLFELLHCPCRQQIRKC